MKHYSIITWFFLMPIMTWSQQVRVLDELDKQVSVETTCGFGTYHPNDTFRPRLLFTPDGIDNNRRSYSQALARFNNPAHETLKDSIRDYAQRAYWELSNTSDPQLYVKSHENSRVAQAAAFLYIMGETSYIDPHTHEEIDYGDKVREILLAVPLADFVLPSTLSASNFAVADKQIWRCAEACIAYSTAWDLLVGSSFPLSDTDRNSAAVLIKGHVDRLYALTNGLAGDLVRENKIWKASSAVGIGGITFYDDDRAGCWVNYGLTRYYDIMNNMTTQSGGYAEGAGYLEFAANSFIPFAWAHDVITNNGNRIEQNDDICLYCSDPTILRGSSLLKFKYLADWGIGLRMPDGRRPNFDDGRYSGYPNEIVGFLMGDGLYNWDVQNRPQVFVSNGELLELRLVAFDPSLPAPNLGSLALLQVNYQAGTAALRTGWGSDDTYMFVTGEHGVIRRNGWWHEHADATSFVIARGSDVVAIDGGYDKFSPSQDEFNDYNTSYSHSRVRNTLQEPFYGKLKGNLYFTYPDGGDLDAELINYGSAGLVDYLEVNVDTSYNVSQPSLKGPKTKRHVIFDRSGEGEPVVIMVDSVGNDLGVYDVFEWQLHGHSMSANAEDNEYVWTGIGSSKMSALVTSVNGGISYVLSDATHADGFDQTESHKVLRAGKGLQPGEFDRWLSVIRPSSSTAMLPPLQEIAISGAKTLKYDIGSDVNVILAKNAANTVIVESGSTGIEDIATNANIFVGKFNQELDIPTSLIVQFSGTRPFGYEFDYSGIAYYQSFLPGILILRLEPSRLVGFYSGNIQSPSFSIHTGTQPIGHSTNIQLSTYENGYVMVSLACTLDEDGKYKGNFNIDLPTDPILGATTDFPVSDIITALNSITIQPSSGSQFLLMSGSNVRLVAGRSIALKPGFHAESGSNFRAALFGEQAVLELTTAPVIGSSRTVGRSANDRLAMTGDNGNDTEFLEKAPAASVLIDEPSTFSLSPNHPNPFNPATTINYSLKEQAPVTLKIYNTLGQEVRTLVNADEPAGMKFVLWDGRDNAGHSVSSGIYIYRLQAGKFIQSRKMLMLK